MRELGQPASFTEGDLKWGRELGQRDIFPVQEAIRQRLRPQVQVGSERGMIAHPAVGMDRHVVHAVTQSCWRLDPQLGQTNMPDRHDVSE